MAVSPLNSLPSITGGHAGPSSAGPIFADQKNTFGSFTVNNGGSPLALMAMAIGVVVLWKIFKPKKKQKD